MFVLFFGFRPWQAPDIGTTVDFTTVNSMRIEGGNNEGASVKDDDDGDEMLCDRSEIATGDTGALGTWRVLARRQGVDRGSRWVERCCWAVLKQW